MKRKVIISAIAVVVAVFATVWIFRQPVKQLFAKTAAAVDLRGYQPFPDISPVGLSANQQTILALTRAEYTAHPVSYDARVLTYSQGQKEAWCADFASWVMKEAGVPYLNPNSGSWRIPGVLTLQAYYQSQNRYRRAGEYLPKLGDVAIFSGGNTRDPFSNQHVAIVLKVDAENLTTIGGNENGHMRVSTQELKVGVNSLSGFGILN